MPIKYNFVLSLIVFIAFLFLYSFSSSMGKDPGVTNINEDNKSSKIEGSRIAPGLNSTDKVIWQKPIKKNQTTIYSGSVKASFGTFNFNWNVNTNSKTELTTLESSGSSELSPKEKKIFIIIHGNNITKLYQEWYPLLNEKKPITLKYIVDVETNELFSAFPDIKLPNEPSDSSQNKNVQPIRWSKIYTQDNVHYLSGIITGLYGKASVVWEKKFNKSPELIAFNKDRTKSKLYILINENNNTSELFMEKNFNLTQGTISYLSYFIKVKTDDLMAGFKSSL
jgi:hypothetical protein